MEKLEKMMPTLYELFKKYDSEKNKTVLLEIENMLLSYDEAIQQKILPKSNQATGEGLFSVFFTMEAASFVRNLNLLGEAFEAIKQHLSSISNQNYQYLLATYKTLSIFLKDPQYLQQFLLTVSQDAYALSGDLIFRLTLLQNELTKNLKRHNELLQKR